MNTATAHQYRFLPENHTPELAALHQRSKELNFHEFWSERQDIEIMSVPKRAVPYVWRWADTYSQLMRAAELVTMEDGDAERRAIIMVNPGLGGRLATTPTMFGAFSCYNPGERSAAHRHTPNASRFGVMGQGGYSTVQGEKCALNRGDLVLTPAGTWHDHGNDSTDERIIWVDVLDMPLVMSLNTPYFDLHYSEDVETTNSGEKITRAYQTPRYPTNYSKKVYGAGGVIPKFVNHGERVVSGNSPMYRYSWQQTEEVLDALKDHDADPYRGIIVEYRDPIANRPVLPTMSFSVQMLRPGERTLAKRETSHTIMFVLKGSGRSIIDDVALDWGENDVVCLPNWRWVEHQNGSDKEPAVLYAVSDEPAMRKLHQFRQEGRTNSGEIVDLGAGQEGALII
jgi:gentisate 1,2-dioxygenase